MNGAALIVTRTALGWTTMLCATWAQAGKLPPALLERDATTTRPEAVA
jgi:hypothetical protein